MSLACILEASSRKGVGWNLWRQIDAQLPLQALELALTQRQPPPGLIHHADRGRQFCRDVYVKCLLRVGADISMSAPGRATDHALAESFFKTVKYEEVSVHQYQAFEEASGALADRSRRG